MQENNLKGQKALIIKITTVPMALFALNRGQGAYMSAKGFQYKMISADGPELENVKQHEKCEHFLVPMTRKITPLTDLKCLFLLIKILKKEQPAIVHTETPKAGLLGMAAARIARVPVRIHTIAGLPVIIAKGAKHLLLSFIEKLIYTNATHIIANGPSMRDYVKKHKLTHKRIDIINGGSSNGVDLDFFNKSNMDEARAAKNCLHVPEDNLTPACFTRSSILNAG